MRHAPADEERPSRSQKNRESAALQTVGEKLAQLPATRRALLPLPPDLQRALADYAGISGFGARRRHLQFIGRLMREAQEEGTLQPVLDTLARME